MIEYASNPKGVMPVVFIKLQNALKSIQLSSVEPERRFSTCWFYGTKVRSNLSDETLSNLPFLNRDFKKLSKSDKSQKKKKWNQWGSFKPLLELKPKFCLKKGRLLMILKESHLRRPSWFRRLWRKRLGWWQVWWFIEFRLFWWWNSIIIHLTANT